MCPLVPVRGMCCVTSGPSVRDVLCVLWSQCKGCVVVSSGPSVRDVLCVVWSQCNGCVVCPLVPV